MKLWKIQIFIHVKSFQIGQHRGKEGQFLRAAFEILLLYSSRLLSNKNHKSLLAIFISSFSGTSHLGLTLPHNQAWSRISGL